MSNILLADTRLSDAATITVSTEDSNFPKENLQHIQPSKQFRTTSNNTQWIKLDLGTGYAVDFIGILHTNIGNANLNNFRIRTATSEANLTASPLYDSGPGRPMDASYQDPVAFGYHNIFRIIPSPNQSSRWILIDMNNFALAVDNPSIIRVGRVIAGISYVPDINIEYDWGIGYEDKSPKKQVLGGPTYITKRPKSRILSYSLGFQDEDSMFDSAFEIDRVRGASEDIFVHKDVDNYAHGLDLGIYGLQESLSPIINPDFNLYRKRYTVREML